MAEENGEKNEELPELRTLIQNEFQKQSQILVAVVSELRLLQSFNQTQLMPDAEVREVLHPKPEGARPMEKVLDFEQEEHHPSPAHKNVSSRTSGRQSFNRNTWTANADGHGQVKKRTLESDDAARSTSSFQNSGPWIVVQLKRIVASAAFTYSILGLIMVNLVLLGIEVDVGAMMPYGEAPPWFYEINLFIVTIFTCEVLAKILLFGFRHFFCGNEQWWNIFDFGVVMLSVLELVIEFFVSTITQEMNSSNLRVMRFVRLARTLRGVRVIRLLRYIGSLRTIVFSIVSTLGSLFWTLVLLLMLFYCFSVIITQSVADYCRGEEHFRNVPCPAELSQHWSSISESMLTLFLAISGGLSWGEALNPLRAVGITAFGAVILYIVIAEFAVMNVILGVFCNTAIESAGADREIAIMKQMKKQEGQMKTLKEIFNEIDLDCSSEINLQELKEALKSSKLRSFMTSIGISTDDVWTLFMTVDTDGSGEISLDEFVHGCMQLQGPAKGLQVARMSYENTVMRGEIKKIRDEVINFQQEMMHRTSVVAPVILAARASSSQFGSPVG